MNAEQISARLRGRTLGTGRYQATCPLHGDRNLALSLTDGRDGVVLECSLGCNPQNIATWMRQRGWPIKLTAKANGATHSPAQHVHANRDETNNIASDRANGGTDPRLVEVLRSIALAEGNLAKLQAVRDSARSLAIPVRHGFLERADVIDRLFEQAGNVGLVDDVGEAVVAETIARGLDNFDDTEPPHQDARGPDPPLGRPGEGPLDPHTPPVGVERGRAPSSLKFVLRPFDELQVQTKVEYLIKGLIPRRGLVLVWGPPKSGKSFWIFDLMLHVAIGRQYCGRRVHRHQIVYMALEGQAGFPDRAEAFRREHLQQGETVANFKLSTVPLDLIQEHKALIENIRRQSANPGGVVIDTLNRSLRGSENDPKDVAAYYRAATVIQQAFDCAVIIIHHCGWEGTRPRGMSSQPAAVDVQIKVERDASNHVVATVELAKDMPSGATITAALKPVELGTDQDGDPIKSCAVVPVDGPPATFRDHRKGLTSMQKLAYRALADAVNDHGVAPQASVRIPAARSVVTTDRWREYFYKLHTGEPEAKKKAFNRASQELVGLFKVGIWEGQVWIV
jgi:hypothetical protein